MSRTAARDTTRPARALSDGTPFGLIGLGAGRMAEAAARAESSLGRRSDPAMLEALIAGIEHLAAQVEDTNRLLALVGPDPGAPGWSPRGPMALDAVARAGDGAEAVAEGAWRLLQAREGAAA